MAPARTEVEGTALVERMVQATNDHNLDALDACFASDYRNETPAHPERGFVGNEQVRLNWTQIFGAIPDLSAEVMRCTVDGDAVWTEWEHRGTRPDGSSHVMRGVVIFGVADGLAAWARFYLEPVQEDAGSVNEAVRRQVTPGVRG
jgi:ketosteroid isomerase-like protein